MGLLSTIGSPIETLKKSTSGFKFENSPLLDTLIGSKIRTLGDEAEDFVYGMMGPFGDALLSAKEQSEIQREIGDKVSQIYPFEKLRDKLQDLLTKKLNRKAAMIGKKDPDARERLQKAKEAIKSARTEEALVKAVMGAVRLDPTLAGMVDQVYEMVIDEREKQENQKDDKATVSKMMKNFDFEGNQDAVKQLIVSQKQAEFKAQMDSNPDAMSPENIKKFQAEIAEVQKSSGSTLKDHVSKSMDNDNFRSSFSDLAKKSAMSQISGKPQKTSAPKSPVQKSSRGRPVGSKDKVQRVRSPNRVKDAVSAMGNKSPNLTNIFNGQTETQKGIASGITEGMRDVPDTKLIDVLTQVEGVLQNLADMIKSGEVKPIQVPDMIKQEMAKMRGDDEDDTEGSELESDREELSWKDQMLTNTVAIKDALVGTDNKEEDKKDEDMFGKLFDSFKGVFSMEGLLGSVMNMFKMVGPILSTVGTALGSVVSVLGPALAVFAAGFAGYKIGEWLNEKFDLADKLSEGFMWMTDKLGITDSTGEKSSLAAAQKAYEDSVNKGTLTEKKAKFFESQGVKVDRSLIVAPQGKPSSAPLQTEQKTAQAVEAQEAKAGKEKGGDTNTSVNTNVNNTTVSKPVNSAAPRNPDGGVRRVQDRYGVMLA